MNLNNLPDVTFVDSDTETVKAAVISTYEGIAGRTLAAGDPVRLFLESIAAVIAQQDAAINYAAKQNLLKYSSEDKLDHIGALVGCERIAASAAETTILITLSAAQSFAVTVPSGTRVSAGDEIFFATESSVIIAAGSTTATVTAKCTATGTSGNGYVAGQIKTIVDPVAYVATMVNTTVSNGGAAIEDDDSFRERIEEAPESFSCAGPTGAYEYWAKTASTLLTDVSVSTPSGGHVKVVPLLEGGELPTTEILDDVKTILSDEKIRPLTDNVTVTAPEQVSYDLTAVYYIDEEDAANVSAIQSAVASAVSAFVLWQKSKLGRDINPSELIKRVINAGAKRVEVTSPVFTAVSVDQVAKEGTVSVTCGGVDNA